MALSNFNKKVKESNDEINQIFKTIEDITDIRSNIGELQRKIFKNG